jgi:hypothetical protein
MAVPHDHDLTPDQRAHQEALNASWEAAQRDLADPEFRARLESALELLNSKSPAPPLTREQFMALADLTDAA